MLPEKLMSPKKLPGNIVDLAYACIGLHNGDEESEESLALVKSHHIPGLAPKRRLTMARSQRDAAYVWLAAGAVLAGLSVILAAIGDHTLRGQFGISESRLFELGTRYQFYHALAIMLCGLIGISTPLRGSSWAAFLFLLGILGFSGGLYVRIALPTVSVGWIIPAGAIIWIIAWILLAVVAVLRIGEPSAFPQKVLTLPKETPPPTAGERPQQ